MKRGNKRIIAVLTLMFVVLIGTTVFGADEEAKYVPQLFGTFLGTGSTTGSHSISTYYKGSL